jgi:hypothetical protein
MFRKNPTLEVHASGAPNFEFELFKDINLLQANRETWKAETWHTRPYWDIEFRKNPTLEVSFGSATREAERGADEPGVCRTGGNGAALDSRLFVLSVWRMRSIAWHARALESRECVHGTDRQWTWPRPEHCERTCV